MSNNYYPGNEIIITGTIRDSDGTVYDPTTVVFQAADPAGTKYTYTYGEDDEITKSSTGVYVVSLFIPFATRGIVGAWTYGLQGKNDDGVSMAFQSGNFKVLDSNAVY